MELEYSGELMSDLPLFVIKIPQSMVKFVAGMCEELRSSDAWATGADFDAAQGEMDYLISALLGGGELSLKAYQSPCEFSALALHNSIVPTTLGLGTVQWGGMYVYPNTPADDTDYFAVQCRVVPGDWTIRVVYQKGPNTGKLRPNLLGAGFPDWDAVDTYAASPAYNQIADFGVSFITETTITVRLRTEGKNVLSSGYYLILYHILLIRTGD